MFLSEEESESGAVAIEFSLYLLVFSLLCGFLMDMSFSITRKGQVERVSSSLMMVLRERVSFYDGVNDITLKDASDLKMLADLLMRDKDGVVEDYELAIRMISFSSESNINNKIPNETFFSTGKVTGCDISSNKTETIDLTAMAIWGAQTSSIQGESEFWYPVYEITLCVPGAVSYFKKTIGRISEKHESIYIRNASLPRI